MGLNEWAIVRSVDVHGYAFYSNSGINSYPVGSSLAAMVIQPVFYLNSDVTYVSGTGTKSSPIRIN